MDRNTLLAFVLSMAVYFGWVMYTGGFQPPEQPPDGTIADETIAEEPLAEAQPAERPTPRVAPERPPSGENADANRFANTPAAAAAPELSQRPVEEREFAFDQYVARVSTRGGTVVSVTLPEYREADEGDGAAADHPIELVRTDDRLGGVLQTPFRELGIGDLSRAVFSIEEESERSITFALVHQGITVRKRLGFEPERYAFSLEVEVENGADHVVEPTFEIVWPALADDGVHFRELSLVARQSGRDEAEVHRELVASYGSPGFFGGLFGGEFEPVELRGGVDWAGVDVKYFLTAIAPAARSPDTEVRFQALSDGAAAARILEPPGALAPGNADSRRFEGFLGPKHDDLLEAAGRGFEESVDLGYSWIAPLTRFFRWLLRVTYSIVGNYGVAIIVITVLVRIVTLPIMMRQMKSMEKMRSLQPRMKELQEKYADDRQKQSEEMMKMYRETGVNPLASCFPMLLQFPVFIGLFYALQSSIDLWQAPFIFWIDDLSSPEQLFDIPGLGLPVRLLPIIMAASMVLQQKMTPTTIDPSQETMMLIVMPAMMLVLFYQFPSGLVLYWMISNFLGIAHQLWIRRGMEDAEAKA